MTSRVLMMGALSVLAGCGAVHPRPERRAIPLGEVIVVSDMDRPFPRELRTGEGGGLNLEMMFGEYYQADLIWCRDALAGRVTDWAGRNALTVTADERDPRRLLLHIPTTDPRGFFEIVYRFHPEHRAVRAALGFYDEKMELHAPESIRLLMKKYQLSALIGELRNAVTCRTGERL